MHNRTKTEPAAISRVPTTSTTASTPATDHGRRRRLTSSTSPSQRTPAATSYFSPQPTASGSDPRSPTNRRAPASRSAGGHGIDTSQGPPIALITRGSYSADIARRAQKTSDFAFAQQQLLQVGLVSPGGSTFHKPGGAASSVASRGRREQSPVISRSGSTHSDSHHFEQMASSPDESSDYDAGIRSPLGDTLTLQNTRRPDAGSGTDGEHTEDLFLNIAQDTTPQRDDLDGVTTRTERRRSRIARASNRQSLPTNTYSSAAPLSASTTPNTNNRPSAIDTQQTTRFRRTSQLPSPSLNARNMREQSPVSPANALDSHRNRMFGLSPQPSFSSSRSKDMETSPQLLPQYGRRRPSFPEASGTPPNRAYRPSNLHYSSSRDHDSTPRIDTPPEPANNTYPRPDGTESADSIGAPSSVWDELDELKSRIRRIELSGKMPATSGAAVSNGSGERPRTATTTVTTVSSSPKHYRKPSTSPSESTIGGHTTSNVHPLLHSALAKAKENVSPSVYRGLESTISEALALAALTGSAGPQGTLYSASSIINGATVPDRQIRRKADSLCRSLTELCITLCEVKINSDSTAFRGTPVGNRLSSVQVSNEVQTPTYSPHQIRQSVETESGAKRLSPSRALSRIEARRSSLMGLNGGSRESSQEPTPSNRLSRAGTSLLRRGTMNEDEEDDPTSRAPSRAMTDFGQIRASARTNRLSRDFSELQPAPSLQHTSSLRRPRGNTTTDNAQTPPSSTLLRDGRGHYRDHQTPPAYDKTTYEKNAAGDSVASEGTRRRQPALGHYVEAARAARASAGAGGQSRLGSLSRKVRGNSIGD